jgi:putative transcription antitermination factor YqgF
MNSPLLGLDIGLKRTGVALSESGIIAQPLTVIEASPPHMGNVVTEVCRLIQEYGIRTLAVGLPYTAEDGVTAQSLKVEGILTQLEEALAELPEPPDVIRINEFASSLDAKEQYPHDPIDSAAAAIILQSYLDENQAL